MLIRVGRRFLCLAAVLAASGADAQQTFTIEVAEDFTRFAYTPVSPADSMPERGATFVTEGFLYLEGTIPGDGSTFDPTSQGAIGTWTCRGIHLVSAAELATAPLWVHTAQLFATLDGGSSLTTDGVEGNILVHRAVTGGAGLLRGCAGEQIQELIGFNASGGVNLRVTFVLDCID
jgi:hypothetical protein